MNKTFLKLLTAVSLTCIASLASADIYVGGGLYASSLDGGTDFDDDDKAMTVFVGWEPPIIPFLSAEVAYHDLGAYAYSKDAGSDDTDFKAYSAQAVAAFPIVMFDIYGKLGYAKTEADSESESNPYLAVGVAFTLLPIVDIYAEYQRFEFNDDVTLDLFGLGAKATF